MFGSIWKILKPKRSVIQTPNILSIPKVSSVDHHICAHTPPRPNREVLIGITFGERGIVMPPNSSNKKKVMPTLGTCCGRKQKSVVLIIACVTIHHPHDATKHKAYSYLPLECIFHFYPRSSKDRLRSCKYRS